MRSLSIRGICFLSVLVSVAPPARADDFLRNAWGVYAAPTIYGFAEGRDYQLASSGGGLDFGAYYAHAFTSRFSIRAEVRYGVRAMDDAVQYDSIFFPDPVWEFVHLWERVLEFPLVVQGDRRVLIDGHELRVSAGGGGVYAVVIDQKILTQYELLTQSELESLTAADSYQKVGVVLDGGVTLGVDNGTAVFARIRLQQDTSTFGEPDDADVIRKYWATSLYVGFEAGF